MNRYLIDTNVISETSRHKPHPGVMKWLSSFPVECHYTSVMNIGEIVSGVESCEDNHKQEKLRSWVKTIVLPWFEKRILPIDYEVANAWGVLNARSRKTQAMIDSLLAATALVHEMTLVTRNEKHFNIPTLEVINPWMI